LERANRRISGGGEPKLYVLFRDHTNVLRFLIKGSASDKTVTIGVPVGVGGQLAVQDLILARGTGFPRAPFAS